MPLALFSFHLLLFPIIVAYVMVFIIVFFLSFYKMGPPRPLFVYFCSFQTQILQKKTLGFSRIRTRIVGVEGEHADHLVITTAPFLSYHSLFEFL